MDVKAQSHSKLYNRAESLLGSHTSETGRKGKQSVEKEGVRLCLLTHHGVHAKCCT